MSPRDTGGLRLLTPEQAAGQLGVSVRTLARLRAEGHLAYVAHPSGRVRGYEQSALNEFMTRSLVKARRREKVSA